MLRYAATGMAIVFVVFAAVQYNDPDGLLWVGLYGFAVLASAMSAAGRHSWLPVVGLVVYAPGFVLLAPSIDGGWWHSEQAREGLGLLAASLWMCVLIGQWLRSRDTGPSSPSTT